MLVGRSRATKRGEKERTKRDSIYCVHAACDEDSTLNGDLEQHYVVSLT